MVRRLLRSLLLVPLVAPGVSVAAPSASATGVVYGMDASG